jgi:hypothetical protein
MDHKGDPGPRARDVGLLAWGRVGGLGKKKGNVTPLYLPIDDCVREVTSVRWYSALRREWTSEEVRRGSLMEPSDPDRDGLVASYHRCDLCR